MMKNTSALKPKSKPLAFIYLDFLPSPTGSGAHLRFYSNAQALIDSGFNLEFIVVSADPTSQVLPDAFAGCRVRRVPVRIDHTGLMARIAFRLGRPTRESMRYAFPRHRDMLAVAEELILRHPEALHFIEGEHLASTLPYLPAGKLVWSCHDLPSPVKAGIARVASELERRSPSTPEKRDIRFALKSERLMARSAPLILTISDADRVTLQSWGYDQVETLPMSIPGAEELRPTLCARADRERISLLHLGATSHLPSYDSLKFLIGEVLPMLSAEVRSRLHIRIVGRSDQPDQRSIYIKQLAARYPKQVEMLGFVEDLEQVFADSDLQVVAPTEKTGLRTRIVESFARGLPVAGTTAATAGLIGIRPGENIFIADSPPDFASMLTSLMRQPTCLSDVAANARRTYDEFYGRNIVAESLAGSLRKHLFMDVGATSHIIQTA
jgi:hypothetical protein